MACGGAVEHSKIGVDDSVFISSNESALNIRKPECTYYARIARIKRQVNFARRRIYSLPCCIGATRSALAVRFRSLSCVGNLVA